MKCLCCNEKLSSATDLKKHYVEFHDVGKMKYFFRKFFLRHRAFCPKKYFVCEEFLSNRREEKVHNFLKHYQQEGRLSSKNKPIKKTFFDSDLEKYCITSDDFLDFCNTLDHD